MKENKQTIIETYLKDRVFQFRQIKLSSIDFSDEMHKYCQDNHCGRYQKNWMCPPAFNLTNKLNSFKNFENVIVFNIIAKLNDSFDYDGMEKGRKEIENIIKGLRKVIDRSINYQIIGAGTCTICKNCTYPEEPCRFPKIAMPSMEAMGIDVLKLAYQCGMNYYNGINTVTYFALIIY